MIYYTPQFPRRNKRRRRKKVPNPRETIYRGGVSIWYERAFHLRLITLCSTLRFFSLSFAQLPLFIHHFFSIRTFSVLFIYSLRSFEQQKSGKHAQQNHAWRHMLLLRHRIYSHTNMPSHPWIFVCVLFSTFFFSLSLSPCGTQQRKCFGLMLSMTLFVRDQMLRQQLIHTHSLTHTAAASYDMAACDDDEQRRHG